MPSLPPLWKVRRELVRLGDQFRIKVTSPSLDWIRQVRYDSRVDRLVSVADGALPLTDRVAVFILFQPRGIAASTILTLDHLKAEGWSPLVVSNAPLSPADREQVRDNAALLIERPNIGYDFGAYRDGMRRLAQLGHSPSRLILMNDSTWFPLRTGDDSLRRMEATGADMAGHIYKIENAQKRGRDHLESHLLMFTRQALDHPKMKAFWRGFVMSNERQNTILRGEKGITQAALAAGLPVAGLLSRDRMVELLEGMDEAELLEVFQRVVLHRDKEREMRRVWLAEAAQGVSLRDRFLAWSRIELSSSVQHLISVTFVELALVRGGMGFVKKAKDMRHHMARMAVLRGLDDGHIPPLHPAVQEEIETAVRTWVRPPEWSPVDESEKIEL